jgi:hypothetical protein
LPQKHEHVAKAKHDEEFVNSLDVSTTPYLDWAITALFYAALHYVEAYFATMKRHSPDHRTRDSAIRRDSRIGGLYNDYSELKNFSINARYYMTTFTPRDLTAHLLPCLANIRTRITAFL